MQEIIAGNKLASCLVPMYVCSLLNLCNCSSLYLCTYVPVPIALQSSMPMSPLYLVSCIYPSCTYLQSLCLTQCPLPIVLFLASYAYATTLSPVQHQASSCLVFYCNKLQCCFSISPITARQACINLFQARSCNQSSAYTER